MRSKHDTPPNTYRCCRPLNVPPRQPASSHEHEHTAQCRGWMRRVVARKPRWWRYQCNMCSREAWEKL